LKCLQEVIIKANSSHPLTCSLQSRFLNACSANPAIFSTHLLSTWQLALDR